MRVGVTGNVLGAQAEGGVKIDASGERARANATVGLFGGGIFFDIGRLFDYDEYSQYVDNKN